MGPAAVADMASPDLVCVTGASGHLGTWLVKRLLEKGYRGLKKEPIDILSIDTEENGMTDEVYLHSRSTPRIMEWKPSLLLERK